MIVTTIDNVAGREIGELLGVARGNTVRAKHLGRDILAGLKSVVGGEIGAYTEMLTEARQQATDRRIGDATRLGADAVVNVRYTTSAIAASMSEILAYGTAVKLK